MSLLSGEIEPEQPAERNFAAITNCCSLLGLVLAFSLHVADPTWRAVTHFTAGILVGISLPLNLYWGVTLRPRKNRES